MVSVVAIAVALAVDAAVVSAGLGAAGASRRILAQGAVLFGLAQVGMAGLGAAGGAWLAQHAAAWDHWIAAGILALIGGRMIRGGEDDAADAEPSLVVLLSLALATSIDALAAGVSLPVLATPVPTSLVLIGTITLVLSALSGAAGRAAEALLGPALERLAGVVLIGIGAAIIAEHLGGW